VCSIAEGGLAGVDRFNRIAGIEGVSVEVQVSDVV
jgi:hypothetical protein